MCRHIERGVNLEKLSAQLSKSKLSLSQCEGCVNDVKTGAGKESKGRSSQKKAARLGVPAHNTCHQEEKWVCLACGHVACGGALSDHQSVDGEAENNERGEKKDEIRAPTSVHAWKHSVLAKHPLALRASDNLVCWCFICNMPVEYPMPDGLSLNTHDNLQPVSWRNPLADAAEVVRERLSKKKGCVKDPAKTYYTMDPVRCVIDTVRCVIDSATHSKTIDVGNPSTQYIGSGKKCLVKGLMNLGNTCFFNSIMQNLLALSVLREHFSQPRDSEGPLTSSLRSLYQEINSEHVPTTSLNAFGYEHGSKRTWKGPAMWGTSEKVCNPRYLFDAICAKAPRFRGFQQQDSHELLRYLLEGLNLEERSAKALPNGEYKKVLSTPSSKVPGQNGQGGDLESAEEDREHGNTKKLGHPPQVIPTFVESVFGGQLSSTVHCCECGHVSVVNETMLDLSLQIPTRQTLKKRQACENLGELSLFGERSHTGSLHEDSKPVEPAQMMGGRETHLASASLAVESKEYFLSASSSAEPDRINPFWTEVAEPTEVPFDAKFSVHDFDSLGSGVVGLQSAEGSLQNSFDVPYCADDCENTLFANVEDCIPGDPLKAGWDPLLLGQNVDMNGHKEADTWWGMVSASETNGQNEKNSVESLTANAFEQPQDKHVLVDSKDEPSVSGSLLLPYGHSEVASNCREELSQFTYAATECKSLCVEGEGLPSPVLEIKKCFQSSSQLVEGAEALSDISQKLEAPKGHVEGNQVTRKSISTGEADAEASDIAKGAVKSEQCIDSKDYVSPLSLEACLADFIKSELLCGDNAWECENCSRLAEEKAHSYKNLRTRDGHLSTEVVVNSKDLGEDFLGQKDEKVALVDGEVSSGASSGIVEGDCPLSAIGDHKVDQTHSGGDCFTIEMGNHGNITHTLADMCKNDQRNELGTGEANNDDGPGGAQSSVVAIPPPLVKKHVSPEGHGLGHTCSKMLPNLRKEKLSFFSGFFFKTENHKVKIGQQQKLVRRNATKKFLISRVPLVLTVHLKRFAQDAHGRLNKLCGHVAFSEFLDLQPFLDPRCIDYNNCVYRLVGIVEHGGTMRGGHYVAYVRGPCVEETSDSLDHDKDSWYHISDSSVQKSTLQDVLGREAYLLFYERHNAKEEN